MKKLITLFAVLGLVLALAPAAQAAVLLTATDALYESSFNTAGHWADSSAPSAGKDYVVPSGFKMRTPHSSGADYVFAGDSLTLAGTIQVKGTGTMTVSDLRLDGGTYSISSSDVNPTLAGAITLLSGGGKFYAGKGTTSSRPSTVTATISGSGLLTLRSYDAEDIVTLNSSGPNTHSGGTIITHNNTVAGQRVNVIGNFALGTGDVRVNAGVALDLSGGDDFIDSAAYLILDDSTALVDLDFSGTDTIGALSFDGDSTFAAIGLWGAVGNGDADFTDSQITGTGLLNVTAPAATPGTVFIIQ
jgi:hypothetical protein